MNKRARIIIQLFIAFLVVFALGVILIVELEEYKAYKSFCKERPSFCYCSWGDCEFKTQSSTSTQYINGELISNSSSISEDTIALCNLARELNNKKTLFRVGCPNE